MKRVTLAGVLAAALCLHTAYADAASFTQDIGFTLPDLNPWAEGKAFTKGWQESFGGEVNFALPVGDLSLSGALGNFMGLPKIGFVEASVDVRAKAYLDLGYHISGGVLSLQYPGQAKLSFDTQTTGALSGQWQKVGSSFTPGLTRLVVPPLADFADVFGPGYKPVGPLSGMSFDSYQAPNFKTAFPTAAAWAGLNWDARASVGVTAGVVKAFGECLGCKRFDTSIASADTLPLLRVDSGGIEMLGQTLVPALGKTYGLGIGTVRLDYPDVAVAGTVAADGTTLHGRGVKPLIQFSGSFDKLLPVVGPLLSQKLGPFYATLLSIQGGPTLSVYQEFEVKVSPKLQLDFSAPVAFLHEGQRSFGRSVVVEMGDDLSWLAPVGFNDKLRVTPTYLLGGTINNETGLTLGLNLDIDAMALEAAPLPSAGPLPVARVREPDLLPIELYSKTFGIPTASLRGEPVDFAMHSLLGIDAPLPVKLESMNKRSENEDGTQTWALDVSIAGVVFSASARGRVFETTAEEGAGIASDILLQTLAPLSISVPGSCEINIQGICKPLSFELGQVFCIRCLDTTEALAGQGNYFEDGDIRLYVNRLDDAVVDQGVAAVYSTVHELASMSIEVGPVVTVPEPGTWVLLFAGLVAVHSRVCRRRSEVAAVRATALLVFVPGVIALLGAGLSSAAYAAELTVEAQGYTSTALTGGKTAQNVQGGVAPTRISFFDIQGGELELDPKDLAAVYSVSTEVQGAGQADFGTLAARVDAQAQSKGPYSTITAQASSYIKLGFKDYATVVSATLPVGEPVELIFRTVLASAYVATQPIAGYGVGPRSGVGAGATFEAEVMDLTSLAHINPYMVHGTGGSTPGTLELRLPSAVGHQLFQAATLRVRAEVFLEPDGYGAFEMFGAGSVLADHTAHLYYVPQGDVTLVAESGHDYLAPVPMPDSAWMFGAGLLAVRCLVTRRRAARCIQGR